jgi:hypothetical protein
MPVKEPVRFAGIGIDLDRRVGDRLFAGEYFNASLNDVPGYESALVQGLNTYVKPGMTVVVVGTGIGVTAVVAAKRAAPGGKVICFEGSRINVDRARVTAKRNGVADRLQVNYALIGPAIGVYHDDHSAPHVDLKDLPHCDLLELDCEGSEKQIIADLPFLPRHILVETHGMYGASTEEIAALLQQKGYAVTDLGLAEPRMGDVCAERDIRVLAAERSALI